MTVPSYATQVNVFFHEDKGLSDVIELADVGGVKTLFLWDNLPLNFQTQFNDIIVGYGNTLSVVATAGYQAANFGGVIIGSDPTGLTADNTAGYQEVLFGATKVGGDPSGLANDATVYTATITVDGGAGQPISIVGSASQTFTTVLAEINADLTGATATIEGGNIRVTSDSTAAASAVLIVDIDIFATLTDFSSVAAAVPVVIDPAGIYNAVFDVDGVEYKVTYDGDEIQTFTQLVAAVNTTLTGVATMVLDNLPGYQEVTFTTPKTGGDSSGLTNDATTYTATIDVDGAGPTAISIVGSASQTLADVAIEITADLTGATAIVDGGKIRVTSDDSTSSSSIAIVDTDLFSTLTDFDAIETAVADTQLVLTSDAVAGEGSEIKMVGTLFTSTTGFVSFGQEFPGVDDLEGVLRLNKFSNGNPVDTQISLLKLLVEASPRKTSNVNDIYWNGSAWLRLADDAAI